MRIRARVKSWALYPPGSSIRFLTNWLTLFTQSVITLTQRKSFPRLTQPQSRSLRSTALPSMAWTARRISCEGWPWLLICADNTNETQTLPNINESNLASSLSMKNFWWSKHLWPTFMMPFLTKLKIFEPLARDQQSKDHFWQPDGQIFARETLSFSCSFINSNILY